MNKLAQIILFLYVSYNSSSNANVTIDIHLYIEGQAVAENYKFFAYLLFPLNFGGEFSIDLREQPTEDSESLRKELWEKLPVRMCQTGLNEKNLSVHLEYASHGVLKCIQVILQKEAHQSKEEFSTLLFPLSVCLKVFDKFFKEGNIPHLRLLNNKWDSLKNAYLETSRSLEIEERYTPLSELEKGMAARFFKYSIYR